MALVLAINVTAQEAATSANLDWGRLECAGETPPDRGKTQLFTCGFGVSYRTLSPGMQSLPPAPEGCAYAAAGFENPSSYTVPVTELRDNADFPCADRSCLCGSPSACAGKGDWVAVVDWNGWHGLTVSYLIREVSDEAVNVGLFDLGSALASSPISLPDGVSDLHVLAQLCEVLEAAEAGYAPSVLNMSFGRLETCGAREPAGSGQAGITNLQPEIQSPTSDTLSSEIERVLDRLVTKHSVALIAAAGNHGKMLFPATYEPVVAVGSLNIPSFLASQGHELRPSWESPPETDALFPGTGICLPSNGMWRAPSGTSYSAAVFSGWFALARSRGELTLDDLEPHLGVWSPVADDELKTRLGFLLSRDGIPLFDTGSTSGSNLLARMFDPSHACWTEPPGAGKVEPSTPSSATLRHIPSIDDVSCEKNKGTPASNPCVPCVGFMRFGGSGKRPQSRRLTLDLSGTPRIPDDMEVLGIALRIGQNLYPLDLPTDSDPLADINDGTVQEIAIDGFSILPGQDASLYFEIGIGQKQGQDRFWTSSPILLPEPNMVHVNDMLFEDGFESGDPSRWSSTSP